MRSIEARNTEKLVKIFKNIGRDINGDTIHLYSNGIKKLYLRSVVSFYNVAKLIRLW